jgi:chorismate mutase/prephenate dehydratase
MADRDQAQKPPRELSELRVEIDALDDRLLALLEERARVVDEVGLAKRAKGQTVFHDPVRERQVLDRLCARGAGRFPADAIRAVFREVMSACLSLEEPVRVAFLGPEGTFSHVAAREVYGLFARYREATTIDGVFDAVRRGAADFGVVPLESSSEGAVTFTLDALLDGDLLIRQEVVVDVTQCLLGTAAGLTAVERVHGHAQALAQCRLWLARHLPAAAIVQTPSTAAAAREALADPAAAAVASRLAGDIFGLPVLREQIDDRPENATRFVVVAKADAPPTGRDRTTIAFSVRDEHGALRRALAIFDDAAINLSHIESRPSRQRSWDYVFLADFEGHRADANVAAALAKLGEQCAMVRVLGSYPRATER